MAGTPGSTPYLSYEAFAGLKYHTPFYAHDFHPGGLCKWRSIPRSTPYFSYEAFAGLKHYTPFYAHDFYAGGLSKWHALPVLPPPWVTRLLRVWSIAPLFRHMTSTQKVCVNGEHPPFYPVLQLWGFCRLEVGLSTFCSEKAKKLLRNMPKSCSKVA